MPNERSEKLLGHWRVVVFSQNGHSEFVYDECIFCGFRTSPPPITGNSFHERMQSIDAAGKIRWRQISDHNLTHPQERFAQCFFDFLGDLHTRAAELCFWSGLMAFEWPDYAITAKYLPDRTSL